MPIENDISKVKALLFEHASNGNRIDVDGRTLFAGFKVNNNWDARKGVLKERLERMVIPGAKFNILRPRGELITSGWEPLTEIIVE